MGQNYGRVCAVQIDGLGRTYDAEGVRVRFSIKQATLAVPNTALVRLTNINRPAAEAMAKNPGSEGTLVSISAGYKDNNGILFQGHVVARGVIYGRENPTDTLFQVLATDGSQAMAFATVNKTLPAGSTPKDHVDEAIKSMGQYAVKLGIVGPSVDLSQPKYPRSVTLFGMARKVLDDVARSKGATWGIQNLSVDMLKPGDDGQGGAFVLNSQTGLIGMPTLTPDGVYVRTFINPQFKVNGRVRIDQSLIQGFLPSLGPQGEILPEFGPNAPIASIAADGIYRIVKIDTEADTRDDPWYMDMMVIKPGETTPATIDYDAGQNRYHQS